MVLPVNQPDTSRMTHPSPDVTISEDLALPVELPSLQTHRQERKSHAMEPQLDQLFADSAARNLG
jgi:hypothetical protein